MKGGLGIKSLILMNKALLSKWAWRFAEERNIVWKIVISLKYGTKGGWFPKPPRGNASKGLWKGINSEAINLKQNCIFELRERNRIRFWEDTWCGELPLCVTFPTLYNIAGTRKATIEEVWDLSNFSSAWNQRFLRPFNDWEVEQVQNFVGLLNNKHIFPRKKDKSVWKGNKNGQFSMRGYYNSFEEGALLKAPVKTLRNPYVPSKVSFFAWEAWWGEVLTMNQLKNRGYQLASICPFCRKNDDSLDHILIHCLAICELWTTILSVTRISWACPYMVKDLFYAWS